jgi:23S rRNA (pseudouridine1915-N3)-methyltransferase
MPKAAGRELVIAWAGRHQRASWEEICADYRRRIARFVPVRDLPVKARDSGDDPGRQRAEGRALLAVLPEPFYLVALDGRGQAIDSPGLAARLSRLQEEWPHAIAFAIGSDLGLAPEVLDAARWTLSLGPLTLGHELARAVLYEQLFRGLSIAAGMSYHREPI